MTKGKKLKRSIRARAESTGERYAAARRQVLAKLPAATRAAEVKPIPAAAPSAKGGVTDAKVLERTGQPLSHWFALLDAFGGAEKGHTLAARHLHRDLGVDGWYAQGITVAYERARGLRAQNQTCEGDFEVSVSRVLSVSQATVIASWSRARTRTAWLKSLLDPAVARAAGQALASKLDLTKKYPTVRFRAGAKYELGVSTKTPTKCTVHVALRGLRDQAEVTAQRRAWSAALDELKAQLVPQKPDR